MDRQIRADFAVAANVLFAVKAKEFFIREIRLNL